MKRESGTGRFVQEAQPSDRFMRFVRKSPSGCWLWTGYLTPHGYGRFYYDGHDRLAHRVSLSMIGVRIESLDVDHLCRNRNCVNPDHLEPVPHIVNARRGEAGRVNREKTHCPQGHPYEGANLLETGGGRVCRKCHRARNKKYWAAKQMRRAAAATALLLVVGIVGSFASVASPITTNAPAFSTLQDAKDALSIAPWYWESNAEMVGAAFCDPEAGRAATIVNPCDLLTLTDDNRSELTFARLSQLTCGRIQIDHEQYGLGGLDYRTLTVLFIDSGIDCGIPLIPGTPEQRSFPSVPEPGTVFLVGGGFALALTRRLRCI